MAVPANDLSALLGDFADRIDHLWDLYDARGPGEVDSALFAPIEERARQLSALSSDPMSDDVDRVALGAAITLATDLARRCATLPQGLCFVSGEAGLVPRRDQIDAFAAARATVRFAVERLKRA